MRPSMGDNTFCANGLNNAKSLVHMALGTTNDLFRTRYLEVAHKKAAEATRCYTTETYNLTDPAVYNGVMATADTQDAFGAQVRAVVVEKATGPNPLLIRGNERLQDFDRWSSYISKHTDQADRFGRIHELLRSGVLRVEKTHKFFIEQILEAAQKRDPVGESTESLKAYLGAVILKASA